MSRLYGAILEGHLRRIEDALPGWITCTGEDPLGGLQKTVLDAMEYACAAGGKRLRPVLVLEFCRICGGDPQTALPFACAMEMVHCYSLVHDDLPCLDNSPLRRGRPSVFAAYGEGMAVFAGDALLSRAFEVALHPGARAALDAERVLNAVRCLADASGAYGMVGGQVIDLESEDREIGVDVLEQLQRGKTAALISASCRMGAYLAGVTAEPGSEKYRAVCRFGEAFGLGFQIIDDILDATSCAEALGKPAGSDAENHKSTYVSLLGVDGARRLAEKRTGEALTALKAFGTDANELCDMTKAFFERKM